MNTPANNLEVETAHDVKIRLLLRAHLESTQQSNIDKNVDELMSFAGYAERFHFFVPHIDALAKERLLISGCAVGSEHLVARSFGFREIIGTEISMNYVRIARERFSGVDGLIVDFCAGSSLPYASESFSMIYSGHVIEHSGNPFEYFKEHLRVLRPGGYFFLEFPTRYHWRELHTGVVSLEWLPERIRNLACTVLAADWSPLDERRKHCYRDILTTLTPVSLWQIQLYLLRIQSLNGRIVAVQRPAPGFVRVLLRKNCLFSRRFQGIARVSYCARLSLAVAR